MRRARYLRCWTLQSGVQSRLAVAAYYSPCTRCQPWLAATKLRAPPPPPPHTHTRPHTAAPPRAVCTVRIRPKTGSDTAGPALNLVEVWLYDSIGNTIARSALTFALDQTLDTGTTPSLFPASK